MAAAAVAVVVVGASAGCSGTDPEEVRNRRETYCTGLAAWQRAERAAEGGDEVAGYGVVAAAKALDQEGLDVDGSHILQDTGLAVGGDPAAEGRAAAYCADTGFETLVK
ncbi:hypothetical protein [Streptomyces sp. enrichment culture]|uniref:hypothetical protein n=1 Tax=Streptomyces sp. enrichment culture TaxID=1795815 RepID=UPI003F56A6EA